jgi:hypothetical protein
VLVHYAQVLRVKLQNGLVKALILLNLIQER